MIDLEKIMYWTAILATVWIVAWMSHVVTMKSVAREINELVPVHVPEPEPEQKIPFPGVEDMNRLDSIAFCQALIIRTSTFGRMIRDSHQSNLMYLLERMREMEGSTLSELQEVVRGRKGTQTAEETRKLIEALEGYHLVQLVEAPRTKKAGRPPSPTIRINPMISLRNIRNIPDQGGK